MVTRWVALLRGIAPMHPNQKNVQLRGVCEELGLRRVASVLSSGNLVFDADTDDPAEVRALLEAAWPERLGFESASIVRTADEIAALVAAQPFGARAHGPESYLLTTFIGGGTVALDALQDLPAHARFEVVGTSGREVFTVMDSTGAAVGPDTMTWLESRLGPDITSRTWRTVERVLARC